MNQTRYRNWVRTSFNTAVHNIVNFHGPTDKSFTARELTHEIRRAACESEYLDLDVTESIMLAQQDYRQIVKRRWFFYEFGERVSRALNTAVKLGLLTSTVRTRSVVKRWDCTHTRTILEYKLA